MTAGPLMESSAPALRVTGLTWRVGGLTIIDDISIEVRSGEFLSLIGPNGAGKTSLINLLSGVHRPQEGSIEMEGSDVTGLRPSDRTRRGLGRTFQTSSLFPGLRVLENVRLAAQAHLGGSLNLWQRPRSDDRAHQTAAVALERAGLAGRDMERVSGLSHGDKRKLELAVVLAADPKVLLLDEPTAGVSAEQVEPLVDLIRQLHQGGRTVVMVEHRMEFVIDVSERIAVLDQGRLLAAGTPGQIMQDPRVRQAYLGQ